MLEERVNQLEAKIRDLEAVPEVQRHRTRLRDDAKRAADEHAAPPKQSSKRNNTRLSLA
jgi:hypothetical protein